MTIKCKNLELNTLRMNGSKENRENVDNAIGLYNARNIPNFRTARNVCKFSCSQRAILEKELYNNMII